MKWMMSFLYGPQQYMNNGLSNDLLVIYVEVLHAHLDLLPMDSAFHLKKELYFT